MYRGNAKGFVGAVDPNERRIVLVGKTGVGKSAAGNTILGREAFESVLSPSSQMTDCEKAKGLVDGRPVVVIDTSGLFDINFTQEERQSRIKRCISLSSPGPHAFLMVLKPGRFTQEEKEAFERIQTEFGEDAARYMMVLFTHGDQLKKQTIEGFISKSPDLAALVQSCSGRYHVFNNEDKDLTQTSQLLDKIDMMMTANGRSYYSNDMFVRAKAAIKEEKERLLKKMEEEMQRELEKLRVKHSEEVYRKVEAEVKRKYQEQAWIRAETSDDFITLPTICLATNGPLIGAALGTIAGFVGAVDPNERRIVLVGKTGVGKSAVGNTILGEKAFKSELSPSSLTTDCHKARGSVAGRPVAVIDTPGLFDTKFTKEELLSRMKMCISLSSPGPHAFLVVLRLGQLTQEEKETVKMIQSKFGEDAARYTMVLFTHGDRLKKQTIEGFISKSPDLVAFIRSCSGRYHVFNNEVKDLMQTSQLLDKIDKMTTANGGSYYTNDMYVRVEAAIKEEKERLLKEREEEMQRELEELKVKVSEEVYRQVKNEVKRKYNEQAQIRAEKSNNFITMAMGSGAATGAALGAVGGPIGSLVGGAIGALTGAVSKK